MFFEVILFVNSNAYIDSYSHIFVLKKSQILYIVASKNMPNG